MCGILGTFNQDKDPCDMDAALQAIAHRGPDHGIWCSFGPDNAKAQLGHRRLSIIDLSSEANQPFVSDGAAIVYNGEIYNYKELRSELVKLGHSFRTTSDTEVVLCAYIEWGVHAFSKFRGMFGLAIYDYREQRLILARDHFGIKPLYYSVVGSGLIFASELKALQALGVGRRINTDAIWASMNFLFVPEDMCAFEGVQKLPAGSYLVADTAGAEVHRFWSHSSFIDQQALRNGDSIGELRQTIEESVQVHMAADVPVGSFLSGGLDSSILTVLGRRHNSTMEAYTIRTPESDQALEGMPVDLHFARKLAKKEGIKLHEVDASSNILDWLPQLMRTAEEPLSDPAALNVMLMCQIARSNGTKVLLSGMGADELFGGYRRHQAMMLADLYKRAPGFLKTSYESLINRMPVSFRGRAVVPVRWARRFNSFASSSSRAEGYLRSYSYYNKDELASLTNGLSDGVMNRFVASHHALFAQVPSSNLPNQMSYVDLHYFLPGLNLAYSDKSSMSQSVEVRTPFVDLSVAKVAFRLAASEKTSLRNTKIALKSAAEAWLPAEIIYRPKASFGVPLRSWVHGPLRGAIADTIAGGALTSLGFVDKAVAEKMLNEFVSGVHDWSYQLWHLLALETWVNQHKH